MNKVNDKKEEIPKPSIHKYPHLSGIAVRKNNKSKCVCVTVNPEPVESG